MTQEINDKQIAQQSTDDNIPYEDRWHMLTSQV